jgi:diguanylate cyclase (GGDEF)-like protein/PAS domain S-box-containing protein
MPLDMLSALLAHHAPWLDAAGAMALLMAGYAMVRLLRRLSRLMAEVRRLSGFVASAPGSIFTVLQRPDGRLSMPFASPGIQEIYGLRPEDVAQDISPLRAAVHREDDGANFAAIAESARTLAPYHAEFRVNHPKKGERWIEARSLPQREPDGSVLWHGFMHDISERKALEAVLRDSETKYKALAESVAVVSWEFDLVNDKWNYVAPQSLELLGYVPGEWIDFKWWAEHVFEDDRDFAVRHCLEETRKKKNHNFEYRFVKKNGAIVWVQDIVNVFVEDDAPVILRGVMVDISQRKQLELALQRSEVLFRQLVENSPDTIARYDRNCRRVYANPTLVAAMGGDLARILGTTPTEFPGGASGLRYQETIRDVLAHGKERSFEMRRQHGELETCTLIRMNPEFDAAGQVVQVLAMGRDITEIDQYRKRIHQQAFSDALTGLPNRALLFDRLRQTVADAAYHGHRFGLMMLDLDHFKEINDSMGHGAGDRLLCLAARRLLDCVRPYDTVARLGGDEFAVVLPAVRDGGDLGTIAGKMVQAIAEPFEIDGREIFVSISIGIALYPGDSGEIDALLKYADSAMYHAKKQGRNNFQFYARELTASSVNRLELVAALHKARHRGELELHYQPQVELPSGRVIGAEALLRWQRPGHGLVLPDRFIPVAEDSGLIVEIGEWVLSTACSAVVAWNRGREQPLKVAVNLSSRQFVRNDLVTSVRRILAATGCQASWLALEITESLLLEDSHETTLMLRALHEMGLAISIDDFGTGYSALSYLNRFPVSQLKIDRSFVRDIPGDCDKSALVQAMLSISTALRLGSVAEGVETPAQARYLTQHGCRCAQGYLFGKPMPGDAFQALLTRVDELVPQ